MDSRTPFGGWLRQRRKLLDLTQQELADQVGCSNITIRKLEAGERKPSQDLATNLALLLQIPDREHAAFIRFARSNDFAHSFSLPAWQPDLPSWRDDQLPKTRPQYIPTKSTMTLHYDVVSLEKPRYIDVGDGRSLFEVWAEGQVQGALEGMIKLQYNQVLYPKPEGIDISQALPFPVTTSFTLQQGDDQIYGTCTGMFSPSVDTSGNGVARHQASGHVISVTIGLIDFFMGRVFLEDEVKMVEGTGTGARGVMRVEAVNQ